jgi:hypothetical protein
MLTVATRGPLAAKMRELAETAGMRLAKMLGDMVLVYEGEAQGGYEAGTSLRRWQERAASGTHGAAIDTRIYGGVDTTASTPRLGVETLVV